MDGKELLATYEEVSAYQIESGMTLYNTASDGRVPAGGYYVLWDRNLGFTDTGWYNQESGEKGNLLSPVYEMTDEQIQEAIDRDGNLTSVFNKWNVELNQKLQFMGTLPNSCLEETLV